MSLQSLIDTYGYLAILIGTFLEGETALILGGIAAHLGFMDISLVAAAALCGTLTADQLYFVLGRYKGKSILQNRPDWQARTARVFDLLQRHETLLILGFRFMYGFRTMASLVIGMSRVSTAKFVVLNIVGAMLWVSVIGGFGYFFGKAFEVAFNNFNHYQLQVFAALLSLGGLYWARQIYNRRKRSLLAIRSKNSNC